MTGYATARHNMVENQLRPSRIVDARLLAAMEELPRERFVPETLRSVAYADEDVPLGDGHFLIEPLALAKLLQSAAIGPQDRALVVGDTSGYAAAVVAGMAASVVLLLPPGRDAAEVQGRLAGVPCGNVVVETGAPLAGSPDQGPFDAIVLIGAVDGLPAPLTEQLDEGGRLVGVVKERHGGKVVVASRVDGAIGRTSRFDAALPPLPGLEHHAEFNF